MYKIHLKKLQYSNNVVFNFVFINLYFLTFVNVKSGLQIVVRQVGTPPLTYFNKYSPLSHINFFPKNRTLCMYLLCFVCLFCCFCLFLYIIFVLSFYILFQKNVLYNIYFVVYVLSKICIFVAIEKNRRDLLVISLVYSVLTVKSLYSQYNYIILPV